MTPEEFLDRRERKVRAEIARRGAGLQRRLAAMVDVPGLVRSHPVPWLGGAAASSFAVARLAARAPRELPGAAKKGLKLVRTLGGRAFMVLLSSAMAAR